MCIKDKDLWGLGLPNLANLGEFPVKSQVLSTDFLLGFKSVCLVVLKDPGGFCRSYTTALGQD